MARTAEKVQIDIDRVEEMFRDAENVGNEDTMDALDNVRHTLQSELDDISRAPTEVRRAAIDAAETEMIAFENEERVSRELKEALQNSRSVLVLRREDA